MRFTPTPRMAVLAAATLASCTYRVPEHTVSGVYACETTRDCAGNFRCLYGRCYGPNVGLCGDGKVEAHERCDDGNRSDNDYCSPDCSTVLGRCGDGTLQNNELCDDGSANSDDWSQGVHCSNTCQALAPYCGDGRVDPREVCDEGLLHNNKRSKCMKDCTGFQTCGNNKVEGSEACDPGDADSQECNYAGGEHIAACTAATCADGYLNAVAGETCDDGNHNLSDGCPDGAGGTCRVAFCGDGVVRSQDQRESCDEGDLNGAGVGHCLKQCDAFLSGHFSVTYHDGFGGAVAIHAETAVVGGYSTVVKDVVHVYFQYYGSNEWGEEYSFWSAQQGSLFGYAVAVRDDLVAVSAPGETVNNRQRAGAIYLFERRRFGSFAQAARFTEASPNDHNMLGRSLALWGDTVLIGRDGAAIVLEREDGVFKEIDELQVAGETSSFGGHVALFEDTALVSGHRAAYLFQKGSTGRWGFRQALRSPLHLSDPDNHAQFGRIVALWQDMALVGAVKATVAEVENAGTVYVFEKKSDGHFAFRKALTSDEPFVDQFFGVDLAASGDGLAVAAPSSQNTTGSVYIFHPLTLNLIRKFTPDGRSGGRFGQQVDLSGSRLIVGAPAAQGQISGYAQTMDW